MHNESLYEAQRDTDEWVGCPVSPKGDDPRKNFDLVIVELQKGKWRHRLFFRERIEDVLDEMNGIFKSKEAETGKSLVEVIHVAETDYKLGNTTPRNDVSDIRHFCPKKIRNIKEITWIGLVLTDQSCCLTDRAPDLPLKSEFRLRKKEHELTGLPNLYCLKDTVMNYINMGTTRKFVEDNVNFTPHSKESLFHLFLSKYPPGWLFHVAVWINSDSYPF